MVYLIKNMRFPLHTFIAPANVQLSISNVRTICGSQVDDHFGSLCSTVAIYIKTKSPKVDLDDQIEERV